jgi:hypothetical protein
MVLVPPCTVWSWVWVMVNVCVCPLEEDVFRLIPAAGGLSMSDLWTVTVWEWFWAELEVKSLDVAELSGVVELLQAVCFKSSHPPAAAKETDLRKSLRVMFVPFLKLTYDGRRSFKKQ